MVVLRYDPAMLRACATLLILALATGAGPTTAGSQNAGVSRWPLQIVAVESPAGADSGQPQLTASDRGVILSWIERTGTRSTLKFAQRRASAWSDARTVASGDDWFVNWADVPSVLRLADGGLAAHWLRKRGRGTNAYDIRLSHSTDGGATWAAPVSPHHDGTSTEHGFASLFQMPGAGLGLVWLDGRATAGGRGHHGAGAMALRFGSFGRDWKQTGESVVAARVCDCCPTAAAVSSEGVIAAFRHRDPGEIRDIHVARLEQGKWTEPVAVHDDGWRIAACPVNGPALSARGKEVAVAWFTMKNEQPQAYAAFSKDAGRTFGVPIRLDDASSPGRVDIELLPDGSAAASYIEHSGGRTQFRVRRVEPSGARSEAVTVAALESSRSSTYPRLGFDGEELVFTWIERDGSLRVKTASARLP
jgi:hypothetical protein